jgi:hypothetical protein
MRSKVYKLRITKISMNSYKGIKIKGKKIDEHRLKMEKKLGRKLSYNEIVHHKDGNKKNNKLSNLKLKSRKKHTSEFMKEYMNKPKIKQKYSRWGKKYGFQPHRYKKGKYWCNGCKRYLLKSFFWKDTKTKRNKYKIRTYCKKCDYKKKLKRNQASVGQ